MKSKNPPPFKVRSYIGTDIAQFLESGGERPPRSAKLVAALDIDPSPGSSDYRIYLLSTNQKRSSWILWQRADTDYLPNSYCRVAAGRPYRGYEAKFAAEQLLTKSLEDERDKWGNVPMHAHVDKAGLLTKEDIDRITLAVFGK